MVSVRNRNQAFLKAGSCGVIFHGLMVRTFHAVAGSSRSEVPGRGPKVSFGVGSSV